MHLSGADKNVALELRFWSVRKGEECANRGRPRGSDTLPNRVRLLPAKLPCTAPELQSLRKSAVPGTESVGALHSLPSTDSAFLALVVRHFYTAQKKPGTERAWRASCQQDAQRGAGPLHAFLSDFSAAEPNESEPNSPRC